MELIKPHPRNCRPQKIRFLLFLLNSIFLMRILSNIGYCFGSTMPTGLRLLGLTFLERSTTFSAGRQKSHPKQCHTSIKEREIFHVFPTIEPAIKTNTATYEAHGQDNSL